MPTNSSRATSFWSIAQVELETGLGKDTLRVWERRYGFPVPQRDVQGDRLYPHEQVQRLVLVKRLMDAGHRPGKVVALNLRQLQRLSNGNSTNSRDSDLTFADPGLADAQTWLAWLVDHRMELIRQTIKQAIVRQGLGTVVDQLIAPLCALVGEAWVQGRVSIIQEHLFTEIIQSLLREAIASLDAVGPTAAQGPRVLLTTTPGEQHGLGLLMAESHLALENCQRFSLGTSTPIAQIVQAVTHLQIDVLALSFSAHCSRRQVVDALTALDREIAPRVAVWVGGAGAARHESCLPARVLVLRRAADVSVEVKRWNEAQKVLAPG